jgi:hypothetical protein
MRFSMNPATARQKLSVFSAMQEASLNEYIESARYSITVTPRQKATKSLIDLAACFGSG